MEIQQQLDAQAREVEIYKRELSAWYEQQRREQEECRITEEQTTKERFKVSGNMRFTPCCCGNLPRNADPMDTEEILSWIIAG